MPIMTYWPYVHDSCCVFAREKRTTMKDDATVIARLLLLSCCHHWQAHGNHSWPFRHTWFYVCESCGGRVFSAICETLCRLSCDFDPSPCCCAAVLHNNIPVQGRGPNCQHVLHLSRLLLCCCIAAVERLQTLQRQLTS